MQRGLQYLVCVSVCQSVCLSVCLSVCPPLYSRISHNYVANKRDERLQRHMGSQNKKPFCLKIKVRPLLAHHGTLGRPFCCTCTLCILYVHPLDIAYKIPRRCRGLVVTLSSSRPGGWSSDSLRRAFSPRFSCTIIKACFFLCLP